jgi:GT2 family glycosyltransferase
MRFPKISIILLNWNGMKDTLECLDSLKAVTGPKFRTLVVDNGSSDGSVAAIRAAHPHVPIFETGKNLGFAGGNNVALEWAIDKSEWILLLNNDTAVDPSFLEAFLAAAKEQPNAKILGAKIYRYSDKNRIDHLGGFWNPSIAEFESPASNQLDDGISFEAMQQVDYVCGAALFMHASVPKTIGLLEPNFFLFWEETDFCIRAKKAGFEVWTAPKAKVYHKVSSSFTGGKPHMHYFWWRSRLLWIQRNCPFSEKRRIYRNIVFPELLKQGRHYLLRSLQSLFSKNPALKEKRARLKAGLLGAFHYSIGRFGNCPPSLTRRK